MKKRSIFQIKNSHAFTLVELMIVIVIITILAAALFPAYSNFINRTKSTATAREVRELFTMFALARDEAGMSMATVTQNACTNCTCYLWGNSIKSPACLTAWKTSVDRLMGVVGMNQNARFYTDEWGHPYLLDENEGENASCDILYSYGYSVYKQTDLDFHSFDGGASPPGPNPYDLPSKFSYISNAACQ